MEILFNNSKKKNTEKEVLDKFINKQNYLEEIKTLDIIKTIDQISKYWISNKSGVDKIIKEYEIGFITLWTKKSNLEKIIKINFNDIKFLDEPNYHKQINSTIFAKPLGLSIHWVAGNIPLLSLISLFQSLLTRNKSIIKVPKNLKNILPTILYDLKKTKFFKGQIKKIINKMLDSILVIYIDKKDKHSQEKLSKSADVRIVWGGIDAVENIVGLPKKINCRDIIFGPKVSLALASKEKIKSPADLKKLCTNMVSDILPFNQAGCNSPHNLIIEKASNNDLKIIANELANQFNIKLKKNYSDNPIDKYDIIVKKFIYQSNKNNLVLSASNNQWNIFVNMTDKVLIENPIYCRSIFLSKINKITELKNLLPTNIQSMGLFVPQSRKKEIIKFFSNFGVDRFPSLGKMSLYENPWDGYLPLQQMVKWISAN